MSGFDVGAEALRTLAADLNAVADAVARPVEEWLGAAGEANAESMQKVAHDLRSSTDDLMDAAEACDGQVIADAKLAAAPTPEDVEKARERLSVVRLAAQDGGVSEEALLAAAREYQKLQDERNAALAEHTDATTQCELPKDNKTSTTFGGDGGITKGDGDSEGGGSANTGEDGVPIGDGVPESGGGDLGNNVEGTPETVAGEGGNRTAPPSTPPISSDPTPSRMGSNVADTAAPANTSLSSDTATLSPQAGSLSTPQTAQPGVTSPAAQPGAVTGAGNMLSNNNQQPTRGGSNPQQRSRDNNDRNGNDGKMDAAGLNALLAPVAAPAGGAAAVGTPAMSSPGTSPSGAPSSAPTAPAPAAATPPGGAPAGNPATGGAPVGGMMGSGNAARAQQQAMAPKPEAKPVISQELYDKIDSMLDKDKTANPDKKAS